MKDIIKLNSLNSLDFQTKGFNAEINVIPGDELRCEIDSSDENKPKIEKSESGDTNYLYINYNDDGFLNNIFGFNFITRKKIYITLIIPEETKNLSFNCSVGTLSVKNLNKNDFYAKISTGEIIINDCYFNSSAFKVVTGDAKINNMKTDNFKTTITTGEAKIKNSSINSGEASVVTGDLRLDSLSRNFKSFYIKVVTGDAKITLEGKEPIYLEKKLTPYTASIKSNLDTINNWNDTRYIFAKIVTGDVEITGKESENNFSTNERPQEEKPEDISEKLITDEERKIINLCETKKISYDFALELLSELGYENDEAVKFLEERGIKE